jgi:hypothetical protein
MCNMARRKPSDTVKLNLRFPESLRRLLEGVAKKQERSMNAEIVRRLENSFEYEKVFGNQRTLILLRLIGAAVTMIEEGAGKRWNEEPEMVEEVLNSVRLIARAADLVGTEPGERADDARLEALKKNVGDPANTIVEMVARDRELDELANSDVFKNV